MRTDELDFELAADLIAQAPTARREQSRLLHYRRVDRSIAHRSFSDLPSLISANDLLVFNDAKVLPARFMLRKSSGGRIEGLFLSEIRPGRWSVLLRNAAGAASTTLAFERAPELFATIVRVGVGGEYEIDIQTDQPAIALLARIGRMPLPPYIKRERGHDTRDDEDRQRYQTVYAASAGSVAAPTAGLHFTQELLTALHLKGVQRTTVTLDVGLGTFKPVTATNLDQHQMHVETYTIPQPTAEALNQAKALGKRIIAVGTTSARVLESQPAGVPFAQKRAKTGILIQPPYQWKYLNGLITNFHLPRSTLIALVAALVGLDEQKRIYQVAIAQRYRFFSYGDAMFIE
jgi:S-adenosylmethionine:tRNA ribosyltransferase-isomerase